MFRRHGRTAIRCPIVLKHPTLGDLDVVTRDISASGIFISAAQCGSQSALPSVSIGDMLEAEAECLDCKVERIRLKVIRHSRTGLGLAFVHK